MQDFISAGKAYLGYENTSSSNETGDSDSEPVGLLEKNQRNVKFNQKPYLQTNIDVDLGMCYTKCVILNVFVGM